MKRRRIIVVLIAVVFVGVVIAWTWTRGREPVYREKKLSEWMALHSSLVVDTATDPLFREAEVAVRHAGTNALPYLLRAISSEAPKWKKKLYAITRGREIPLFSEEWYLEAEFRADHAVAGFGILGLAASPAVPQLKRLLGDKYSATVHGRAMEALAFTGREGVSVLVDALKDRSRSKEERAKAVEALCLVAAPGGDNAERAVPILVSYMQETDHRLAAEAVQALGELGLDAGLVVPALVRGLEHTDVKVRLALLESLGRFGKDAQIALPALKRAFSDPDPFIREMATNTMQRIAPEALGTNAVHLE